MSDYEQEIVEENRDMLDKYLFETNIDGAYAVQYWIEREYTFGYDYIYVLFSNEFSAVCFLLKHQKQCGPNDR